MGLEDLGFSTRQHVGVQNPMNLKLRGVGKMPKERTSIRSGNLDNLEDASISSNWRPLAGF